MNWEKTLISLPEQSPILGLAIAAYDVAIGIKVIYNWKVEGGDPITDIEDMFKIPLLNMRFQVNANFRDFPTSIINTSISKTVMVTSSFSVSNKSSDTLYSFALFIQSDKIINNPSINSILTNRVKEIAYYARFYITSGMIKQMSNLTPKIIDYSTELTYLLKGGISQLQPINITNMFQTTNNVSPTKRDRDSFVNDLDFLAFALSSHIETQMTTVIEIPSTNTPDFHPLFNFLAHFLLPFQRGLSSDTPHDRPISGFFLQVVRPQSSRGLPFDDLMKFNRPWTYIILSERKIIKPQNIDSHNISYNEYRNNITLNPKITSKEAEVILAKIRKGYRIAPPVRTRPLLGFVQYLEKLPIQMRTIACQQQLGGMINKAVALMEAVNQLLNETGALFVSPKPAKEICEKIGIGSDETRMIVSIAQLFDQRMYRRMYSEREDVLMQMVVTI
ncbi:hypothetical protein GPJ56_001979 [Histomonas meleagridis]|uniref:uncharacterized protein n=1 Tax=Histomonas meleagridis TaxID=135588 RepID=UPI0035594A52|nr:hypothetical protein GPJ56_001979 [Histomonas meleagridis]KAH0800945.1 hypothetical protein GO595_006261 [Histomonas meleagridis]